MISLYEQYRPAEWSEVVGQERAVTQVQHVLTKRGWGGRAWWISGLSGTGKTTIARLIAQEGAESCCIVELDATDLTPAELRTIEETMGLFGWPPKGGRAFIINEAHGLRRDTIKQLLVLLERLPQHVAVIFTTTADGEQLLFEDMADASPLTSRCYKLSLNQDLVDAFARRAKSVAKREGLNGQPLSVYRGLAKRHACNLRGMMQEIETGYIEPPAPEAKPVRNAGSGPRCGHCDAPIRHGKKYCSTAHYFAWLAAQKKKR